MYDSYKILHLQNAASAAELTERALRKGHIKFDHYVVDNELEYLKALEEYKPDIILCDHSFGNLKSKGALEIFKSHDLDIPFVVLATDKNDEVAIEFFEEGADDFIFKDSQNLLPLAIEKAIRRYRLESERKFLKNKILDKEKATAKRLSDLSAKFQLATKTAGIGIWEYSFEQNSVEADDILLSHYGITRHQFSGDYNELIRLIFPEDVIRVRLEIQTAINQSTDVVTEFQVVWNNGSIHYLKTTAHLQCDDFGKPCRLIGTSQDITSTKLAEQSLNSTSNALQKALAELNKILNLSLDIIFSIDESGKFVNVSAASEKIWGYTPTELIGNDYSNFVFKEDQEKTKEAIAHVISGRNITNFENYHVCKDGTLVPMVLSARWDTKEKLLYCIAREATEKKHADAQLLQSEQRFKDLVQGGSDLIIILNQEGNYLYVSPNAIDVLGFSAEEFVGKNTFSYMHPDDMESAMTSFSKIAYEKKIVAPPIRFLHKDGSWRWLDSTITNFSDNPGINGIVINARDVTEKKQAYDKLKASESFSMGVLDSLTSHIAVINASGTIIRVNKTWHSFARDNGAINMEKFGEGANYFDACKKSTENENAPHVLKGIQAVLEGSLQEFYFEYPCHSPKEERWFYMRVKKFEGAEPLALIEHQYITERKKSEEKLLAASNTLQHTLKDLNNVMDSSLDVICVIDAGGQFVKVSAASEKIWGFKPVTFNRTGF